MKKTTQATPAGNKPIRNKSTRNKPIHKSCLLLTILACLCLIPTLASCSKAATRSVSGSSVNPDAPITSASASAPTIPAALVYAQTFSQEVQNLEKLCKVWGYVKYTHPAFLLGQRDWDEELLDLMPAITEANESEVGSLLHEWFTGLGDIDYGASRIARMPSEDQLIIQADTSWISEAYLGTELAGDLSQIETIPGINRSKSPVNFTAGTGIPDFSNEKIYEEMNYQDRGYRLLGLFRLWNAMEYYYPYLDILDESWHGLLPGHILKMLEGDDRHSYELTLASLGAKLQDAHIAFQNGMFPVTEFGLYGAPVELTEAEGKIVVWKVRNPACPLQEGDVVCKLEGRDMEDVIEHRKQYIAVTTGDKLINALGQFLLRSPKEEFEVTVFRDGREQNFTVKGEAAFFPTLAEASKPYEILDGKIGLINPAALPANGLDDVMEALRETNGLIIDLRQYPSHFIAYTLAEYLADSRPFAIYASPFRAVPGAFTKTSMYSGNTKPSGVVPYDKNVVVLMDEKTQSQTEFTIMSIRGGENVTVMGENSVGTDGDAAFLPLPGGLHMMFTSQGIFTAEEGQTQRIGLAPDIEVCPTVAGIREGRDELLEAACAWILTGQTPEGKSK